MSKFHRAGFLIFGLVFVSRDFAVGRNVNSEESTVSPRTRLNIQHLQLPVHTHMDIQTYREKDTQKHAQHDFKKLKH